MIRFLTAFVVLASAAAAQDSPHPLKSSDGPMPAPYSSSVEPPLLPAGEVVVYDSLCIVDQQAYDGGLGSWCGGQAIWGAVYDLQAADDVVLLKSCTVTSVTADYVTWLSAPVGEACLNFHRLPEGGRPDERATCHVITADVSAEAFVDTIFGLMGLRITARPACPLRPSRYIVAIEPMNEDWGYQLTTSSREPCGGDAQVCAWVRDGCEGGSGCCDTSCGYSYDYWDTSEEIGFGWRTLSMKITAAGCVPAPAVCCFPDGRCELLLEQDCIDQGGVFLFDEDRCDVQCLCPRLLSFKAKCDDNLRLRVVARFTDRSADGKFVTIGVDDRSYRAIIQGRRAVTKWHVDQGPHTAMMIHPKCGEPVTVECQP